MAMLRACHVAIIRNKEPSMSLNKLFDSIEQARDAANWKSAFGEPQVVDEKTIIPVAQVGYGFGLAFGRGGSASEDEGDSGTGDKGGSGGGGTSVKPYGVIVVTQDDVYFEEVEDNSKIAVAGIAMSAFAIYQIAKTLRVIFGRK
jgi:uncharacterized spore protein YtfJ